MSNKLHKPIRKILSLLVILALLIPSALAFAAGTPPTTISAPDHFAVSHYLGDSFVYTSSAPEDIRALMDSDKKNMPMRAQLDYKLDNGAWHYNSSWDTAKLSLKNTIGFNNIYDRSYISGGREGLSILFPEDKAILKPLVDDGWNVTHKLDFRIRYVQSFDNGKTYIYSDWSKVYTYAMDVKSDPDKLLNHAPTLTSATIEKNSGGEPYLNIKTGRLPGETQDLNAMSGGAVWTEVWLRKVGDKDFKHIHDSFFSNEYITISVREYFKDLKSFDAVSYEIKTRYKIDLRRYPQCGRSDTIYGPFSNVYSQNMPAWTDASAWATSELKKADDDGLIPDSLKGKDLTQPISREEFAELAVRLYEKTTGKKAEPCSPNPFKDTNNPEILKAFKLGITTGTSATTFSPDERITREQIATMLSRAIRIMVPGGDFSTSGAPVLKDQKDIAGYALDHVLFMCKIGIIKPSNGIFAPKAITSAQKASGYGNATREQAILMSVRSYDIYKTK